MKNWLNIFYTCASLGSLGLPLRQRVSYTVKTKNLTQQNLHKLDFQDQKVSFQKSELYLEYPFPTIILISTNICEYVKNSLFQQFRKVLCSNPLLNSN